MKQVLGGGPRAGHAGRPRRAGSSAFREVELLAFPAFPARSCLEPHADSLGPGRAVGAVELRVVVAGGCSRAAVSCDPALRGEPCGHLPQAVLTGPAACPGRGPPSAPACPWPRERRPRSVLKEWSALRRRRCGSW